ncbi:MAG: efflux RND transporter periplasmic adaptor subunit [Pseudomonadales bacterium]|nr:efflux RND transporter periplasmic adaptor subunit [Pseudomonadales bacterium]
MSIQAKQLYPLIQPIVIVIIAIGIAIMLYISRPEQEKQALPETPLSLDAYSVFGETVTMSIQSQGMVQASTETLLAAEVQGRIIEVGENFVAGAQVSRGEILLKIDDLSYRTAVVRAEAALAQAKTQLAEERGRADVAFRDWSRHQKNNNRSEEAKQLALREPQITEAIAILNAAKADLEQANEQLKRTDIIAPYDGLVRSRMVDLGQHVSLGMNLGLYFSTEKAEVRLPIAEHKLALLEMDRKDHSPSEIILSIDLPQSSPQWSAKLSRAESVIDERNRMLYLVAEILDPYQLKSSDKKLPLRVGSFVSAKIIGKKIDNVFRVPQAVIQSDDSVWIINDNGQLQRREIKIIMTDSDYAFISKGLSDNDKIASGYIDPSVSGRQVNIAQLIKLTPRSPKATTNSPSLTEISTNTSPSESLSTGAL